MHALQWHNLIVYPKHNQQMLHLLHSFAATQVFSFIRREVSAMNFPTAAFWRGEKRPINQHLLLWEVYWSKHSDIYSKKWGFSSIAGQSVTDCILVSHKNYTRHHAGAQPASEVMLILMCLASLLARRYHSSSKLKGQPFASNSSRSRARTSTGE